VPADLADALAHDSTAQHFFDALSYTHRNEWVRWIKEAKKPETREQESPSARLSLPRRTTTERVVPQSADARIGWTKR
jgi:Bacteriocin-protection, YdeI or OmpD-Associated